jgi:ATP-binding cassette subfamily F protein 3
LGNYSYYHEKQLEKGKDLIAQRQEVKEKLLRPDWQQREEDKERKRVERRLNRELASLEDSIITAESRKNELEAVLSDPATYNDEDQARLYNSEYQQVVKVLAEVYDLWANLNLDIEGLHGS